MNIYLAWEVDRLKGLTAAALMADNPAELRRITQDLQKAANLLKTWAQASGGSPILDLCAMGLVEISADKMSELPGMRRQFAAVCDGTLSVGVGMEISESYTALQVAKLRGGDQIALYVPEMQSELDADTEESDVSELLGKADVAELAELLKGLPTVAPQIAPVSPVAPKAPVAPASPKAPPTMEQHHAQSLHSTVAGFMGGLKTLPKGSAERGKFITAHMNHGPFLSALKAHPQGANLHAQLTTHLNSKANAGFKPGATQVAAKSEPAEPKTDEQGDMGSSSSPVDAEKGADAPKDPSGPQQDETAPTESQDPGPNSDGAGDDPKAVIMGALKDIKQNADAIENLKNSNPAAFKAVMDTVQAMILMAEKMQNEK